MSTSRMFVPVDLSKPGALEALFSIHRGIFGGHCMTSGAAEGGDAGAGQGGGQGAGQGGGDGAGANGDQGQQRGPGSDGSKPLSEMTADEKLEYFEKKANRLQSTLRGYADYDAIKAERDQLKTAGQTEQEKAVAAAKSEGKAASDAQWQERLAASEIRYALKGIKTDEQIRELVEPLDLKKFLTEKGEVDTDKVTKYAAGFSQMHQPDMGQGRRPGQGAPSRGEAGRSEAERRFGKKKD